MGGLGGLGFWATYDEAEAAWAAHAAYELGRRLENFAEGNAGCYPTVGAPEASLSVLYTGAGDGTGDMLAGSRRKAAAAQEVLDQGGVLPPELCGWHYTQGLTQNDDRGLALAWTKRFYRGSEGRFRWLVLIGGLPREVPEARWLGFLEAQAELLARRDELARTGRPVLLGKIRFPTGEVADRHPGPGRLERAFVRVPEPREGLLRGEDSANYPSLGVLRWRRSHLPSADDGLNTWVLTLPGRGLRSRPVRFTMRGGRAIPSTVVFEMEP